MNSPTTSAHQFDGRNEIKVRLANDNDIGGIARIYNQHIDAGGATFDTDHWKKDFVHRLIHRPPPEAWFVAVRSSDTLKSNKSEPTEDVLGWASARQHSLRYGYRFTCETAIYLDTQSIGQGIGDQLQRCLENHCRASNIHHAIAKIIADNERSIAFHRRFGYELVGIQKEVGHMDGKWCDVAILQKLFHS